jgi:hypothetical protein
MPVARAIESAGGDGVRFSFPKAGLTNLTGEQAQSALRSGRAGGTSDVAPMDVPVNAFDVGANWHHVQDQYGEWWNFQRHVELQRRLHRLRRVPERDPVSLLHGSSGWGGAPLEPGI